MSHTIKRAMTIVQPWERVNEWPDTDPILDEDYMLRVGEYLLTVSTRAEYTAYSIYRGDYTHEARVCGEGYEPCWQDGDWYERTENGWTLDALTEDALLRVSQPMMQAAEVAFRDLLLTQSVAVSERLDNRV